LSHVHEDEEGKLIYTNESESREGFTFGDLSSRTPCDKQERHSQIKLIFPSGLVYCCDFSLPCHEKLGSDSGTPRNIHHRCHGRVTKPFFQIKISHAVNDIKPVHFLALLLLFVYFYLS
jgi:hypothetical protein